MEAVMTHQDELNQVVLNRVQSKIERNKGNVSDTINRLLREGDLAQDFIAPIGVNLRQNDKIPVVTFSGNGHVLMNMKDEQYTLHDNAVGQLADKMNIPSRYLKNLASGDEWQRKLAATVLNEHSGWTQRARVLVRSVGEEVRAVLSDSYRRLNSVDIITAFIQEAGQQGAVIADAYMSDTKIWTETILPTPITIPTKKNGNIVIFAGARFSTSDYGDGAVDMRAFLMNGACTNGMVRESVMKQVHLGSKLPDNLQLSQRTYELDTKTTVSAVRDLTKGLFSKDSLMQKAIEIQGASEIDVDFDKELKRLVKGGLQKSEADSVEKILLKNDPADGVQGGATLWKLTQGLTAFARDIENPRRSREIHEISGALLNRVKVTA
jgi:hypothetical protein